MISRMQVLNGKNESSCISGKVTHEVAGRKLVNVMEVKRLEEYVQCDQGQYEK